MTYFIGLPDKAAAKSVDSLDEAIATCKQWRSMYTTDDYRVTDENGNVLFPKGIRETKYGTMFGLIIRLEEYDE